MSAFYRELPCMACSSPVAVTEPDFSRCPLCQNCNERWYEHLASIIARALGGRYDPAAEHEIEDCETWLRKLYPPSHCARCQRRHVFADGRECRFANGDTEPALRKCPRCKGRRWHALKWVSGDTWKDLGCGG